jgi:2',3'-cyclic-nucleotide 2'-phosphodiesterase
MHADRLRILFIGDIVGNTGLVMFQKHIARLKQEFKIDGIIVNGENSADGKGITPKIAQSLRHNGVNVITTGNHVWQKKEIMPYLNEHDDVLRPANFPGTCPGVGVTTFSCAGYDVGVMNIQGRVFMRELIDCPFRTAESILTYLKTRTKIIFVDFHAETTAEKHGFGLFLDGQVSGVVGTHTHVQTADERILPNGTAFITDLGMVGSLNSMIGMKKDAIIWNMRTQMPVKFEVDNSMPVVMSGVWIEVDPSTGKATDIQRVRIVDNDLKI